VIAKSVSYLEIGRGRKMAENFASILISPGAHSFLQRGAAAGHSWQVLCSGKGLLRNVPAGWHFPAFSTAPAAVPTVMECGSP